MNMNTMAIIASFLFAGTIAAQNAIRIGGVDFIPNFADNSLSQTNRAIICADVERYFSYNGTLNLIFDFSRRTNDIQLENLSHSIHNGNIWTNITIESMSSRRLSIPKALSDTYTNLLVSMPASTSLLQSATAFVDKFNDGSISNISDIAMQRLFRSPDLVPEKDPPELIRKSVTEMWGARSYVHPTIIEFSMANLSATNAPLPSYVLSTVSFATNGWVEVEKYMIAFDGTEWFIVEL